MSQMLRNTTSFGNDAVIQPAGIAHKKMRETAQTEQKTDNTDNNAKNTENSDARRMEEDAFNIQWNQWKPSSHYEELLCRDK